MGAITDVKGILVGHYTDNQRRTGCTVILCADGAVAGVDIRGTVLGTHEIDLVRSGQLVKRVNAVLLTGGSTFGLQAVQGVVRYLEERKQGFKMGQFIVPIVTAASIFDLDVAQTYPDAEAAYRACAAARSDYVEEGAVGVGTGALVGKAFGAEYASKGGVGTASKKLDDGVVGALVVVNCFGCVVDPRTRQPLAGPRDPASGEIVCDVKITEVEPQPWANNFVAVVATDLPLTKGQANEAARGAHEGFARMSWPSGFVFDSSVVYVLSTSTQQSSKISLPLLDRLHAAAIETVSEATLRAVRSSNAPL